MQSIKNTILKEDLAKFSLILPKKKNCGIAQYSLLDARDFWVIIFLCFFIYYSGKLGIKKIIGVDNFLVGENKWVEDLERKSSGGLCFIILMWLQIS